MAYQPNENYQLENVKQRPRIAPVLNFFPAIASEQSTGDARAAYQMALDLGYQDGKLQLVAVGHWHYSNAIGTNGPEWVFTVTQALLYNNRSEPARSYASLNVTNSSLLCLMGVLISRFETVPDAAQKAQDASRKRAAS